MLEVLLSLFLIAFVLFSLIFYEGRMLRETTALQLRTIAESQLLNLSEILKVDSKPPQSWRANTQAWLPDGHGAWRYTSKNKCIATLSWVLGKKIVMEHKGCCL